MNSTREYLFKQMRDKESVETEEIYEKEIKPKLLNDFGVFIYGHTGSGKTLPAEFAFKWFTSKGKKVIYASPIKALSNQKLHDMRLKYPDISFGLLTGDVKDNPDADVLIVTTEILRNTLFNMQVQEKTQKEKRKLEGSGKKKPISKRAQAKIVFGGL